MTPGLHKAGTMTPGLHTATPQFFFLLFDPTFRFGESESGGCLGRKPVSSLENRSKIYGNRPAREQAMFAILHYSGSYLIANQHPCMFQTYFEEEEAMGCRRSSIYGLVSSFPARLLQ